MEHHQLEIGEAFFDEVARKQQESPGEVVMVIRRPAEKVLLLTKEFYPAEVYRLPSGMIKKGETPEEALVREAREETGLQVSINRRLGAIHFILKNGSRRTDFISYLLLTDETTGEPAPEDLQESISGFREVHPCDLPGIAAQLSNLPEPWRDWGRFRSPAHNSVHRELCSTRPASKGQGPESS